MQFKVQNVFRVILQGLFVIILLNQEICGYPNCPIPSLARGKVRTRLRSRIIRFQCYYGFEILGHRYATCFQGKWDVPIPVCIQPGCPDLKELSNGMQHYTNRKAAVMFICHPGYILRGENNMYCNGSHWNGTQPTCVGENAETLAMSCDFEQEDMCGWMHDPVHDFDWTRQNRKTPSGHIGTGPSYDHTLGEKKDGYYMYIESSSRRENDTARLLSPLYPPDRSTRGCFSFYYHMYGRTTGTLKIYMRPESIDFNTIINDIYVQKKYVMFEKSGNQGNHWYTGFFDLIEVVENFQIIVEGIRGPGYVSDIAIDDVAILQNEQCIERMKEFSTATAEPVTVKDSCLNRCNNTVVGDTDECQCNVDCLDSETCCPDYRDFCVFESEDAVTDANNTTDVSIDESSIAPMLPTSLMMTETNSSQIDNVVPVKVSTTTIATTTSTQPTVTVVKTEKTDVLTKLSFATPSLPIINATGIINDNSTTSKTEEIVPLVIKTTDQPIVRRTTIEDVTIPTTDITEKSTKIYFKKIVYTQDAHEDDTMIHEDDTDDSRDANPTPVGLIVVTGIAAVVVMIAAAAMLLKYNRKNKISGSYVFGRTISRFRNSIRTSSSNADMKFLVQEEELEHDYAE